METKRVKRDYGGEVDSETNTMAEDRISQLSDRLIHRIFSFLPTVYLVRMSLLSKRWRHVWVSTPFIYLEDFKCITFEKKFKYKYEILDLALNFIVHFLRCRKLYVDVPDTSITSFKFDVCYICSSGISREIDGWLSFVVQRKVKELNLHYHSYCLPQFVLSASSLTLLKLKQLKLVNLSPSNFPSLKVLSLECVEFDSKSVQNLFSGCPIIENLCLSGDIVGNIDLAVCGGTLKSLSLSHVEINDQWLNRLISRLPILERLTFKCFRLKNISIHSQSLKYLFCDVLNIIEVDLRIPNLVFLHFACVAESNIFVEAPKLLEATLSLHDNYMDKTSYVALVRLLSNLNFLKKLTLIIEWQEALIIQKRVRQKSLPPLPNLKHLKVDICASFTKNLELRESLHWCAPSVETLQIFSPKTMSEL